VLTLEDAVREAVKHNLNLLAERFNLPVAQARIVQARLRPNPILMAGLDYQDWLGTGFTQANAGGPPEGTTRVDFPIERGHKRAYRIEVAQELLSVAQLQLANTTRQLILDVQNAFNDVVRAKESLDLARQNLKALDAIVEVNAARVRAGDLAKVELLRSRLAALQFNNAVRQAELRLTTARKQLQLLLGRSGPPAFDVAAPTVARVSVPPLPELIAESLRLRPDLEALRRDQARSLADLRLQIAQGKIDYDVAVQYHGQYDTAHANSLALFFTIPLPVWSRNQGEIARARIENDQTQARIKAQQAVVTSEVENAYAQYTTSLSLLETIESEMLQQARDVREITEFSYRRGEASLIEFLDAQRAFNDTMQSYSDARAEYARSLYLLESTTGKTVNP
jgi:cobalt-zinc-cadmium efflux system outer membrane protein